MKFNRRIKQEKKNPHTRTPKDRKRAATTMLPSFGACSSGTGKNPSITFGPLREKILKKKRGSRNWVVLAQYRLQWELAGRLPEARRRPNYVDSWSPNAIAWPGEVGSPISEWRRRRCTREEGAGRKGEGKGGERMKTPAVVGSKEWNCFFPLSSRRDLPGKVEHSAGSM